MKYNAFISYRHNERDSAVAHEIQKRLERFHIPSAIRKQTGIERIDRLFLDQAELDIGSDLSQKIDEALAASEYLIVICSPAYNESKWCLHEIEEFLRTHDRSHILTVLSEGEPPAVFPELLCSCEETLTAPDGSSMIVKRPCEPLACDYRQPFKEADKTELPRLAAALIGCSYDELIMRRAQYNRQRMLMLTSIIAVLSAIAISYLLYSNAVIRSHYRQTLIKESNTLSVQSLQASDNKDRMQALAYALEALPSESLDRPVTPEALYALQRASGAYELPGTLRQTYVYQESSGILDMAVTSDNSRMAYLDASMTLTAVDLKTKEKTAVWHLDGDSAADLMMDDQDLLYVCHNGAVSCFDLTGHQLWHTPLQFQMLNRIHMSDDQNFIAAADAFAVQVMHRADGTPYASYRIPSELKGHIKDVCWAPDGRTLAVIYHEESGHEQVGFFDEETGHFTLDETVCGSISDIFFLDAEHLLIVSPVNPDTTYSELEQTLYAYENTLQLRCISTGLEEIWQTELPYSHLSLPVQIFITSFDGKDVLVCTAEDHLTVFDPDSGSVLTQYDAGGAIAAVYELMPDHVRMITAAGNDVTAWRENGQSLIRRTYPQNITKALTIPDSSTNGYRICLISNGCLSIFENTYDTSLQLSSEILTSYPEAALWQEDSLTVCDGADLITYRLNSHEVISRTEPEGEKVRILAGYTSNQKIVSYLLDAGTGTIEVQITDPEKGSLIHSFVMPVTEYNADNGVLAAYGSIYGGDDPAAAIRQFLQIVYHRNPPAALSHDLLFSHSYADPNTIHITDLEGTDRTVSANVSGLLKNGEYDADLSALIPDPQGECLYTVMRDERGGYCGVIVRTDDGSSVILEDSLGAAAPEGIWNQDGSRLAVLSGKEVQIYDDAGSLRQEISYSSSQAIQAAWYGTKLLTVTDDQKALLYDENGNVMKTFDLNFENSSLYRNGYLRIRIHDHEAVLTDSNTLQILDLSQDGTRPVLYVPHNALDYAKKTGEIIVAADLSGNEKYCIGFFVRRSTEELIQSGYEQLK